MERSEKCPLCRQPVTRREYQAIEKRIRKEERARVAASEAKARRELREEHQREVAALAAGQTQRLARQREMLQADHDRAILKVKAEANRENERLQRRTKELQRALEKKTAHELGDGPERDLEAELRAAFGDDAFQRVPRGELGADILHDVRYKGAACGRIIYDSKNHKAWRTDFVTKLRSDKARHEAAAAVLVTTVFPAGARYFSVEGEVCLVHPDAVVHLAGILRRSVIALHRQGLSLQARSGKMAALYKYLASGDFADQIRTAEGLVADLRTLDARERDAHEKVWKERERLVTRTKATIDEIDTRVTSIMERDDGAAHEAAAG
jgi:hypothetical protein